MSEKGNVIDPLVITRNMLMTTSAEAFDRLYELTNVSEDEANSPYFLPIERIDAESVFDQVKARSRIDIYLQNLDHAFETNDTLFKPEFGDPTFDYVASDILKLLNLGVASPNQRAQLRSVLTNAVDSIENREERNTKIIDLARKCETVFSDKGYIGDTRLHKAASELYEFIMNAQSISVYDEDFSSRPENMTDILINTRFGLVKTEQMDLLENLDEHIVNIIQSPDPVGPYYKYRPMLLDALTGFTSKTVLKNASQILAMMESSPEEFTYYGFNFYVQYASPAEILEILQSMREKLNANILSKCFSQSMTKALEERLPDFERELLELYNYDLIKSYRNEDIKDHFLSLMYEGLLTTDSIIPDVKYRLIMDSDEATGLLIRDAATIKVFAQELSNPNLPSNTKDTLALYLDKVINLSTNLLNTYSEDQKKIYSKYLELARIRVNMYRYKRNFNPQFHNAFSVN